MKKIAMFLALLFAAMVSVMAQKRPVVVIVPFDAKNVNRDEVDVISDVFLSEYTSTGKATVVDRSSFDKIKVQHKFESSDWSNAEKVAELGKALNANQIITGQVSQFGNQLVCTIKLLDVNTTEIISSTVRRVANMDALFEECTKLSTEIAAKAALSVNDYKIGSKGLGGGTVFAIEGDLRWEVSEALKVSGRGEVWNISHTYISNGIFQDWNMPTISDAELIYNNLVKGGYLIASGLIYIGEYGKEYFSLKDGQSSYSSWGETPVVRLVRKFNINDTTPNEEVVGNWQGAWNLSNINTYDSEEYIEILKTLNQKSYSKEPLLFRISIRNDRTFQLTYDSLSLDCIENIVQNKNGYSNISYTIQNFKVERKIVSGKWSKHPTSDGSYYLFTSDTGKVPDFDLKGTASGGRVKGAPTGVYLRMTTGKRIKNFTSKSGKRNQEIGDMSFSVSFGISKHSEKTESAEVIHFEDKNSVSKIYRIGDKGQGGGTIFFIDGNRFYECTDFIGRMNLNEAIRLCKDYRGGGYSDWQLPTDDDMKHIHQVKTDSELEYCWTQNLNPWDSDTDVKSICFVRNFITE